MLPSASSRSGKPNLEIEPFPVPVLEAVASPEDAVLPVAGPVLVAEEELESVLSQVEVGSPFVCSSEIETEEGDKMIQLIREPLPGSLAAVVADVMAEMDDEDGGVGGLPEMPEPVSPSSQAVEVVEAAHVSETLKEVCVSPEENIFAESAVAASSEREEPVVAEEEVEAVSVIEETTQVVEEIAEPVLEDTSAEASVPSASAQSEVGLVQSWQPPISSKRKKKSNQKKVGRFAALFS